MDNVIKAIQQLLKNAVSQAGSPLLDIKKVYYGDPIVIPASSLPALAIQPITTEYLQRGSRYDQKQHTIEVRLIYNAKSYFSETPSVEKVDAIENSINKIEQTTNFETANYTVCGVIEKNAGLPYNATNSCQMARVRSVNYTFSETRGFPSYEVVVSIEATVVGDR